LTALNVPFTPWHPNLLIVSVGFWGMGLKRVGKLIAALIGRHSGAEGVSDRAA
jgi:hypothetical protein